MLRSIDLRSYILTANTMSVSFIISGLISNNSYVALIGVLCAILVFIISSARCVVYSRFSIKSIGFVLGFILLLLVPLPVSLTSIGVPTFVATYLMVASRILRISSLTPENPEFIA